MGFVSLIREGDKLVFRSKKSQEEYNLKFIDHFLIKGTVFLLGGGINKKIELFALDIKGNQHRLYINDIANNLKKYWDSFGRRLEDMTGKKVEFTEYVEDLDGEVLEKSEYKKRTFKKRIKLFDNPYR